MLEYVRKKQKSKKGIQQNTEKVVLKKKKRVYERILEMIQKIFTQQSVEENETKRYIEKC